ncbi:MAG: hypothetical protein ACFB0D_16245 [Phormidesmis sp.]
MNRQEQLVCLMALWTSMSAFPEDSATHELYKAMHEKLDAELKPEEGEIDAAMSDLARSLKEVS